MESHCNCPVLLDFSLKRDPVELHYANRNLPKSARPAAAGCDQERRLSRARKTRGKICSIARLGVVDAITISAAAVAFAANDMTASCCVYVCMYVRQCKIVVLYVRTPLVFLFREIAALHLRTNISYM